MHKPVIGVDLGGTNMQIGVVDAGRDGCRIIGRARRKTFAAEGCEAVLVRIADGAAEACAAAGIGMGDVGGLGVAAPGAIDIPRGIVIEAPNLQWRDVPLRDMLRERLRVPVVVDNDVNGAIWGERMLGAGRGQDDLLGVWLGTGVGGGLVLGGRLYHGPLFTAGEVGQTIIDPFAPPGARTVEDNCSRTGISRAIRARLQAFPGSALTQSAAEGDWIVGSEQFAQAVREADALAMEVMDRAAFLLGVAIANWVTVLALARVVIGGGVTECLGEPFLARVRASFEAHVFPQSARTCRLVMTELAADAGLLGAALLAENLSEKF